MRFRARTLLHALGLVLALVVTGSVLAGCSSSGAAPRTMGDPVTTDEAKTLAGLLHDDYESGGAHFVEVAPFAEGAVLTLTGDIDFAHSVGHATAVTTYKTGQPQETRTVFFTPKEIWFGDVPGLADALKGAGLPAATYVRRPLSVTQADGSASLVDVLAQVVLNLSSHKSDDPQDFLDGGYTWQGQRTVNGQLAAVYQLKGGSTVAISPKTKQLVQYQTTLPGQDWAVTISLSDHGKRQIDLPSDAQTLDAKAHPGVAAAVGIAVA